MSVKLAAIIHAVPVLEFQGEGEVPVLGLTQDSRVVRPGWLFAAVPGTREDGSVYVEDALRRGAVAILSEKERSPRFAGVPWIRVRNVRKVIGQVSALVYGDPTSRLTLVGITGTNGKTTISYLLEAIISASGGSPGVVGTVSYRWGGKERAAERTTPDASELQAILRDMEAAGVTHAVVETSSHGLVQGRLDGCRFDVGVFTNLTQDHLDYHRDMEDYFHAKSLLFTRLLAQSTKGNRAAVINTDDPHGERLSRLVPSSVRVCPYGMSTSTPYHPRDVRLTAQGVSAVIDTPRGPVRIQSRLAGEFNLMNILAAVAAALEMDLPLQAIGPGIESVKVVPGRLERIPSDSGTIFVDYAHTPQALKNVLAALRRIHTGRIVTVMGCGGDRDRAKRPLMGAEAALGSDFLVVTSDNPRSEDPDAIIREIIEGVRKTGYESCPGGKDASPKEGCYLTIPDRREALSWAVENLRNGDVLLVAGKGHETYQEINGVRHPFDDRDVVREALAEKESTAGRSGSGTP